MGKGTLGSFQLTQLGPLAAVDVVRQVALFLLQVVIVEHHPVGAQLLGDLAIAARVILVTLLGVGKVPVRLRTVLGQLGVGFLGSGRGRGLGRFA